MKIAFISFMRGFAWGGSEELWFRAAKLALANGYAVSTLTQQWDEVPDKIAQLRQLGAATEFYAAARYGLAEKIAIKLRFRQWVADRVPDVQADVLIFSSGSTWDFIEHAGLIKQATSRGQPYAFVSQHSFENGHIVGEGQRAFAIGVLQQAERLFFVAERNRQVAERQLGCRLEKAETVSNPVNIRRKAVKPFPGSATLAMACVARLDCDFKGQDILLQVLSAGAWTGRDYRLKLFGSGPHRQHLQRLITLYDLADKVSVEGHVHDIDEIWEHHQVLVLPSLSEGTPLSLVEAMLSGRAAVATDVGDIGRYVRTGETGFLAQTASINSLAESLEQLWAHKSELRVMGEAAFLHASEITDFNPENKLLQFIERVVLSPDANHELRAAGN